MNEQVKEHESEQRPPETPKPPSLLDSIFSVLAAFFGVQSEKNRQRDFAGADPKLMISIAIITTAVFICLVLVAVDAFMSK